MHWMLGPPKFLETLWLQCTVTSTLWSFSWSRDIEHLCEIKMQHSKAQRASGRFIIVADFVVWSGVSWCDVIGFKAILLGINISAVYANETWKWSMYFSLGVLIGKQKCKITLIWPFTLKKYSGLNVSLDNFL